MVQWLELCAFTAEGTGSIPGPGAKSPQATVNILQAAQHSQKGKKPKLKNFLMPPFGNYHIVIGLVKNHRWMLKLADESLRRNRI